MISSTRRIFFYGSSPPPPSSDRLSGIFYNMLLPHDAPLCLPFLTKRLEKKLKSYLRKSKSRIVFTKYLRAVIRCHWAGPPGSPSACKQHAPSIRILSRCSLIPAIFLLFPHHAEIMMPFFSEPTYGPILKHESSSFCKKIVTLHRFFQHPAESCC